MVQRKENGSYERITIDFINITQRQNINRLHILLFVLYNGSENIVKTNQRPISVYSNGNLCLIAYNF